MRIKLHNLWKCLEWTWCMGKLLLLLLLLSRFSRVRLCVTHRRQPTRLPRPWDSPGKNTEVGCHFLLQCMKVKSESEVAQSCLTLSDPMDCSLSGSSIHGIFQARVLEWGAIWTVNFQMFKLDLEKAEEPEIKLPTSVGSSIKQESSRKTSISPLLTTLKPWLSGSQQTVENSERDGNTRLPDLSPEKSVCR